jgi:hypothetical protein
MDLLGHLKWLSNLGCDHGGHVCPIEQDAFLSNINTTLEKVFRRRGEKKDLLTRDVSSKSITKRVT